MWKKNKTRKKLTNKSVSDFSKISNQIWTKYNKRNLEEFIRPYRYRADVVIYKNKNHAEIKTNKNRVFIIHNNHKGGVEKYVIDIMNLYNTNEYH